MARKRLVDLLREEAQKSPEPEDEKGKEENADVTAADATLSVTSPLDEITAPSPVTTPTTSPAKRTPPTKAELEKTVTELQQVLQENQQEKNELQQQIADLQSDLHEQKTLVQKLQAELKQASQIKADFEQAKKVILQLSEVNSKITQEVNTLKEENEGPKSQKSALKKLPDESIQPNSPSTRLSNTQIGWFD